MTLKPLRRSALLDAGTHGGHDPHARLNPRMNLLPPYGRGDRRLTPRADLIPRQNLDLDHALVKAVSPLAHNLRRRGMSIETFAVRLNLPLGRALAYVEGRQSFPLELWRRLTGAR